ncbi:MAG: NADH-quinone oxidoreductase subunit C [Bacteroidota bacterium]|jgi:NADH:ubiquinone oxidoreductase subunit C
MSNEDIKTIISELLPNASFEEGGEWLNIGIEAADWKDAAQKLRNCETFPFNFLFCLTCVDWKTHFTMVYHLRSTTTLDNIVVKVKLDREKPEILTVSDIWRGAELFEREVYDLFGVIFLEHPDLRRLLLTDDWVGYPLRKDYEDPINMIKL